MHAILTLGYAKAITQSKFSNPVQSAEILWMQTAQETRKQRLLQLKKKHGTWAALNKLVGWESTNARLSQIGAGSIRSGRNTPYVMGDDMAREIEKALGLPCGWMDTPLTYADMHGEDDPRTKAMQLMESMPPDQWATAVRLLDALAQPATQANGTTGHH